MTDKREIWIDGLKFIACINVFITHFIYTFYTSIDIEPHIRSLSVRTLDRVTCAEFAVFIFVIISGYLASKKNIHTLKDLIKAIVIRYISLFIPIFFMSVIYIFLYITIGVHIDTYATLFNNEWLLSQSFPLTGKDFIKSLIFFDKYYLGVLWMIPLLIKGNIIIYLFNYLFDKKSDKERIICSILFVAFLYLFSNMNIYIVTTVAGIVASIISSYLKKLAPGILMSFFIIGIFFIKEYPFLNNTILWSLLALLLFSIIMANNRLQLILSTFNNSFSLPIYLIHLPLTYSLSLSFYSAFNTYFSFDILFWINLLFTSLTLALLSWIFLKTVSPITKKGVSFTRSTLEKEFALIQKHCT